MSAAAETDTGYLTVLAVETYCRTCGFTYAATVEAQAEAHRESCAATGLRRPHDLVRVEQAVDDVEVVLVDGTGEVVADADVEAVAGEDPDARWVRRSSKAAAAARAKLTARELDALRVELRRELRAETRPARTPRVRETPEVAAAAVRMTRAVAARAAVDVDALPLLVTLRDAVDAQLAEAVRAARDPQLNPVPWSWADVGRVLGITKQAAQQRFGTPQNT